MHETPKDLPRRAFTDAFAFLTVARALVEVGAWEWRPKHMMAHTVSEMEAVTFLRFATVRMVRPDARWEGRWRIEGRGFDGRRIGLSVSVWMAPDGERVYFASAFRPTDP